MLPLDCSYILGEMHVVRALSPRNPLTRMATIPYPSEQLESCQTVWLMYHYLAFQSTGFREILSWKIKQIKENKQVKKNNVGRLHYTTGILCSLVDSLIRLSIAMLDTIYTED